MERKNYLQHLMSLESGAKGPGANKAGPGYWIQSSRPWERKGPADLESARIALGRIKNVKLHDLHTDGEGGYLVHIPKEEIERERSNRVTSWRDEMQRPQMEFRGFERGNPGRHREETERERLKRMTPRRNEVQRPHMEFRDFEPENPGRRRYAHSNRQF